MDGRIVVICLKNRTFAVYKTTSSGETITSASLWFAWKIVPLRYTKQPKAATHANKARCDLLEKSYLCGIQNNFFEVCLKVLKLWFAWKIVPLRYTKQRSFQALHGRGGCDLLEKSYLCGIQNNWICRGSNACAVVICLKNRTFAVYKTTHRTQGRRPSRCDLLEKSYLCGIQNNNFY